MALRVEHVIIGENIRIQGTIEGDEDLVIRGRVQGTVRLQGALIVEAGAWLVGDAHVTEAQIHGTVRGNVTARDGIELSRTGRMLGDALAPRVTIAAGAAFRGRVEMGDLSGAEQEPPPPPPRPAAVEPPPPAPAPAAPQQNRAAPQQAPRAAPPPPAGPRVVPTMARPSGSLKRRTEAQG